jgi:hypothetical protein
MGECINYTGLGKSDPTPAIIMLNLNGWKDINKSLK